MRRVLGVLGGLALAIGLFAVPVTAAPAQRLSDTQSGLFCEALTSDAGTAFVVAVESEQFGTFGDVAFWEGSATPLIGPPSWITVASDVTVTETSVTGTFDLVEFAGGEDPFGDPVGQATLAATLTPDGDPQAYDTRDQSGNQQFRRSGVLQSYAVSGTLNLPEGINYDLSSCTGFRDTFTSFVNAPAASVFRSSQFNLDCFWEVGDRFVQVFASADQFGGFSQVFVSSETSEIIGLPDAPVTLTTESFAGSYELFDFSPDGPGEQVGTAEASATLTPDGHIQDHFSFGDGRVHLTGTRYSVDGSFSFTLDGTTTNLVMDDEACFAADLKVTEQLSPRQGPGGPPIPNDTPESAEPIELGETVTLNTRGADDGAEAPCVAEFGEIPIAKTAWWTFTATADGPVTFDTTGSDFDTVIGIYTDDGAGGLTPIGCVDDFESLQAVITIDGVAGTTYFVQAGGLFNLGGNLVLSVS